MDGADDGHPGLGHLDLPEKGRGHADGVPAPISSTRSAATGPSGALVGAVDAQRSRACDTDTAEDRVPQRTRAAGGGAGPVHVGSQAEHEAPVLALHPGGGHPALRRWASGSDGRGLSVVEAADYTKAFTFWARQDRGLLPCWFAGEGDD